MTGRGFSPARARALLFARLCWPRSKRITVSPLARHSLAHRSLLTRQPVNSGLRTGQLHGRGCRQASSVEKRPGDRALSSDGRHDQNGWSHACRNDVQRIDIRDIELIRGGRTEKLYRRQELPEGIAGLVRGCIPQLEIADKRVDRTRLNVDQAGDPQYFEVLLHRGKVHPASPCVRACVQG